MLSLCDYSNFYIFVKRKTVTETAAAGGTNNTIDKKVIL